MGMTTSPNTTNSTTMDTEKTATASSSRPQFGGRFLVNEDDVFKHNAWDNVEWGDKQEQDALAAVAKNSEVTLSAEQLHSFEEDSATNWDKFYCVHQNKFFKNRNWLFTEFPELAPHLSEQFPLKINPDKDEGEVKSGTHSDIENVPSNAGAACSPAPSVSCANNTSVGGGFTSTSLLNGSKEAGESSLNSFLTNGKETSAKQTQECITQDETSGTQYPGHNASHRVLELGCGVGNTIFPLLHTNNSQGLFVYGGDFSAAAIDIIKQHQDYDTKRCNVFVLDVTSDEWTVPFPPNSLDVITCIYVLSAIHPDKHRDVARKAALYLRPGGVLLFRDYGRYDLAQLRFKKGKCLAQNYYVRGDGTKSYFFTQDEIRDVFTGVGLHEKQNIVDRRLQVNRGKQLTMYRVWVQAKYIKS